GEAPHGSPLSRGRRSCSSLDRRKRIRRTEDHAMKRDANRIPVSHVGSLPRPADLLDMMKVRLAGQPVDEAAYQARVTRAVADIVKMQVECGIDIVSDGEVSKGGFFTYAQERIGGLGPKPDMKFELFKAEREA